MNEHKQSTQTQWGGRRRRPPHWRHLCFSLFYIINIYGYSLYIPYIFHIYIYIYFFLKYMFHIPSLMYFLIYGVNRRQVLIAKPHLYFFLMISRLLCFVNNVIILRKTQYFLTKSYFYPHHRELTKNVNFDSSFFVEERRTSKTQIWHTIGNFR